MFCREGRATGHRSHIGKGFRIGHDKHRLLYYSICCCCDYVLGCGLSRSARWSDLWHLRKRPGLEDVIIFNCLYFYMGSYLAHLEGSSLPFCAPKFLSN